MNSVPTVFVVDDDVSIRRGACRFLKSAGLEAVALTSAHEFLEVSLPDAPTCLLLDIRMPGLNGLDLQREMKRRQIPVPVVFMTGHGTIPMSVQAIREGAVDFLTKPFSDEALLQAVHHALERHQALRQESHRHREALAKLSTLTSREREILEQLISGKLNKQIGADLGIAERTVKIHRSRVLEKMGVQSVAELARIAQSLDIPPAR